MSTTAGMYYLELYKQWWWLFIPLLVWTLVWKAMALWKAARLGSKGWFIAFLLVNTMGILEMLYLYVFSKGDRLSDAPKIQ